MPSASSNTKGNITVIDLQAIGINIQWRGYPVKYMSQGCWDVLAEAQEVHMELAETLRNARDMAELGEPADWYFADETGGQPIWIERAGGIRTGSGHEGGYWTMYLPAER
jgi:hypothetical protein